MIITKLIKMAVKDEHLQLNNRVNEKSLVIMVIINVVGKSLVGWIV